MMSHDLALDHLRQCDPVLADVIARVGPCLFAPREDEPPFESLAKAIVYQQLSTKAAATIHGRVRALFPGEAPTAEAVLAIDDEAFRRAGLSRQKLSYLRDLAARAAGGALPLDRLASMEDEAVIAALAAVKGIGRWTAQMFLMFRLGRPDVLPELDLGIQKALMLAHGLEALPKPRQVLELGEAWRPHRTIASWYLWRSLEI